MLRFWVSGDFPSLGRKSLIGNEAHPPLLDVFPQCGIKIPEQDFVLRSDVSLLLFLKDKFSKFCAALHVAAP
jgi:hypothetical protein